MGEIALNVLQAILTDKLPTSTRQLANYSDSFNPETWILFQLSQDVEVSLTIYNVTGNTVKQIQLGYLTYNLIGFKTVSQPILLPIVAAK